MTDKFSSLLFGRRTDEIYQRARSFARREMDTFVDKAQLGKVDEEDDLRVFELFGAKILKGVADELMNYFPADSYRNSIEELAYGVFNESKESNKPSLKEAKERVALIARQQKLKESNDEAYVNLVIEKFCILMDWEVKPEDVIGVTEVDGKYIMHIEDGTSFTYDPVNDCLTD